MWLFGTVINIVAVIARLNPNWPVSMCPLQGCLQTVLYPANSVKKEPISWAVHSIFITVSNNPNVRTAACFMSKRKTQTSAWLRAAAAKRVSVDTSAWRQSKSPCRAVYRWSQGPATGFHAWLRARRPRTPAGGNRWQRSAVCRADSPLTTHRNTCFITRAPSPPPLTLSCGARDRETDRRSERLYYFSVALNISLRGGKKLSVHHSSAHESTLMMSHAALPASHTTILYYQFSYKRPYLLKKGESRLFFHAVDWAVPPREPWLLNRRATNNLLKTLRVFLPYRNKHWPISVLIFGTILAARGVENITKQTWPDTEDCNFSPRRLRMDIQELLELSSLYIGLQDSLCLWNESLWWNNSATIIQHRERWIHMRTGHLDLWSVN